jgi:hypothetical protein
MRSRLVEKEMRRQKDERFNVFVTKADELEFMRSRLHNGEI